MQIFRQRPQELNHGITETASYRIRKCHFSGDRHFHLTAGQEANLEKITHIRSINDWLGWIHPDDRKNYCLNLQQAYKSDFLISAYRLFLPDNDFKWIIDYGEVNNCRTGEINGLLLLAENIDIAASIVRKWVSS